MKAENPKSKRYGGGSMLGVCLTVGQRQQLEQQATLAGLSLSEYARRKMFGGRPIVASVDLKMLAGLNKFGGLIKNQCALIRAANGNATIIEMLRDTLTQVQQLVADMSAAYDSQKDKDHD